MFDDLGIWKDGCLEILKTKFKREVANILLGKKKKYIFMILIKITAGYVCLGVLSSLVELITVVMACSYVAQITRRIRREKELIQSEEYLTPCTRKTGNL